MFEHDPNNFSDVFPAEQDSIHTAVQHAKDAIKNAFIRLRETEFEKFVRENDEKERATSLFTMYQTEIPSRQQYLEHFREVITSYDGADFGKSLYESLKNNPGGLGSIRLVASELAGPAFIKLFGMDALKLAEQELNAFVAQFETFKKENSKILRELKLI